MIHQDKKKPHFSCPSSLRIKQPTQIWRWWTSIVLVCVCERVLPATSTLVHSGAEKKTVSKNISLKTLCSNKRIWFLFLVVVGFFFFFKYESIFFIKNISKNNLPEQAVELHCPAVKRHQTSVPAGESKAKLLRQNANKNHWILFSRCFAEAAHLPRAWLSGVISPVIFTASFSQFIGCFHRGCFSWLASLVLGPEGYHTAGAVRGLSDLSFSFFKAAIDLKKKYIWFTANKSNWKQNAVINASLFGIPPSSVRELDCVDL